MKTLLDIDDRLLRQAQRLTGAKTKRETVTYALLSVVRAGKRKALQHMLGRGGHGMTLKELLALRARA